MSHNNNAQVTYCRFPPPVTASKFYTCFKKETCCDQGCCINGPYQVYQVWYYWLLFLIVFGIISGGSWFCRKRARAARQAQRGPPATSRQCYSYPRCNRRRCTGHFNSSERSTVSSNVPRTSFEESIVLDRLFVSFRNRNAFGDPPSYSSVLTADNSMPPPRFCPLYSYYGPPPTYSSMFKSPPPPNQQLDASQSAPSYDSAGSSAGITQIQVHVEGNANKSANTGQTNAENEVKDDTRADTGGTSTVDAGRTSAANNGGTIAVTAANVLNDAENEQAAPQGMINQEQGGAVQKDV